MEDKVRGLLARYHDRELSAEAMQTVELHLAGCGECRAELQALRALSDTLALSAEPAPPAGAEACWQAVQPQLGDQASSAPWRSWLLGFLLLGLQGVLGVAGVLLAIGSTVSGLTGGDRFLPALAPPVVPLPMLPAPLVLPLPAPALSSLVSIGLFASAGVLYLIWLALWWARSHASAHSIEA